MGERELDQSRMEFHRDNHRNGNFYSPTWSFCVLKDPTKSREERIASAILAGDVFRINGGHTSTFLTQLANENASPFDLKVTVDLWEADSLSDSEAIFNAFDNPKCERNNRDVMGYYLAHYPELKAVLERKAAIKVANGIDLFVKELLKKEQENRKAAATLAAEKGRSAPPLPSKPSPFVDDPPRQHGVYFRMLCFRQFAFWLVEFKTGRNYWMIGKASLAAEMFQPAYSLGGRRCSKGKPPFDWLEVRNLFEAGMYAARFLRATALT
jgi:hypothetical protein